MNKKLIYIINLSLIFLLLTQLGMTTELINKLGMNNIYKTNLSYLNRSLEKTRHAFTVVSGFKGLISIIEESGIMGVEFGSIIEPLDDLIDLTWRFIIASLISLNIQQLLLEFIYTTRNSLFKQLLTGGLFFLFIFWILIEVKGRKGWLLTFLNITKLLVITAVSVWIIIPVMLYSAESAGDWITADRLNSATARIEKKKVKLNQKLKQIQNRVSRTEGLDIIQGKTRKKITESFSEIFKLSPSLLESLLQCLVQLISCFILEVFIFPAVILGLEYYLIKIFIS